MAGWHRRRLRSRGVGVVFPQGALQRKAEIVQGSMMRLLIAMDAAKVVLPPPGLLRWPGSETLLWNHWRLEQLLSGLCMAENQYQ